MPNKEKNLSGTGEENMEFPGYQPYPSNEDIYRKFKEERDIDPENPARKKGPVEILGTRNEKDFEEDVSGADLDIPGSEADDMSELIGSEDEENNYYSLGGDNHNDLEEDREFDLIKPIKE